MNNIGNIIRRFYLYKRDIKNVWEEFNLINYSLLQVKELQRNKSYTEPFERELLLDQTKLPYKDMDIHLFITRLTREKLPQKSLVEAVALTETYLQDLTAFVYRDYPAKVTHQNTDTPQSQLKLTHLIVNSSSRDEMIEKLIEEKIRGIFYGNPVDFFEKDKAKIGLDNYFSTQTKALENYSEVIARRNIIMHNDNKVDSKYLKEVVGTTLLFGQHPKTDKIYIKNSITTLRGMAALSTKLCLENVYSQVITGKRIDTMALTAIKYWSTL